MNVALIGYGRMGKEIEKILLERGHSVLLKVNHTPSNEELANINVAIEFTQPDVAFQNLTQLIKNKIPTICGTTAWLKDYTKITELTKLEDTAFLYASNFSLGVNLFFELNEHLAKLMSNYPEYKLALEEIHHTKKLDAPSGTAVSIAEGIIKNSNQKDWYLVGEAEKEKSIPITAKREDNVPGTHTIRYQSDIDEVMISHIAHNRKGFALGAVIAAEWIQNKKGVFTMKDVLGL